MNHSLTYSQVIRAEIQHYLRTDAGRALRHRAVVSARSRSPEIFALLIQTYLEECTDERGPSHLKLIERLLTSGGATEEDLRSAKPTPGNAAAIALYKDISDRGAACHMVGAGAVEHYYSLLAPQIFKAYTEQYGMTALQAETYAIHGEVDSTHADRAFTVLSEAIRTDGYDLIEASVRDAFVATSLHYDGMLQAATGLNEYWDGAR